jgi:hypothetical protein
MKRSRGGSAASLPRIRGGSAARSAAKRWWIRGESAATSAPRSRGGSAATLHRGRGDSRSAGCGACSGPPCSPALVLNDQYRLERSDPSLGRPFPAPTAHRNLGPDPQPVDRPKCAGHAQPRGIGAARRPVDPPTRTRPRSGARPQAADGRPTAVRRPVPAARKWPPTRRRSREAISERRTQARPSPCSRSPARPTKSTRLPMRRAATRSLRSPP